GSDQCCCCCRSTGLSQHATLASQLSTAPGRRAFVTCWPRPYVNVIATPAFDCRSTPSASLRPSSPLRSVSRSSRSSTLTPWTRPASARCWTWCTTDCDCAPGSAGRELEDRVGERLRVGRDCDVSLPRQHDRARMRDGVTDVVRGEIGGRVGQFATDEKRRHAD